MKKMALALIATLALAAPAFAADMPAPVAAAVPVVPVWSWTGFYVGGNAGGAWGRSTVSNTVCATDTSCYFGAINGANVNAAGSGPMDPGAKFTGGGQIGFNVQAGNFVYGIEGDINYFHSDVSRSLTAFYAGGTTGVVMTDQVKVDYFATARGRIGYAFGDLLLYATGGAAFASLKHSYSVGEFGFNDPNPGCTGFNYCDRGGSTTGNRLGWTAGGGAEWHVFGNWTLKAEYLYVDLGKTTSTSSFFAFGTFPVSNSTITHSADLRLQIARGGLNYKF